MKNTPNDMSTLVDIKVSEHNATFLLGLSEVRRDKRFFDVKLCVGDKEIDSHKAVLAAFSPHFRDLFDDNLLKTGQDRINLTDNTNITVLTSILDYMYSGSISFEIEDSVWLMRTLDFLKMQYVKDLCEWHLEDNIDAENCFDLFDVSEELPLEGLNEAALYYINKNFQDIHETDEFKKLTKDRLESIIQKTPKEHAEITYQAILGWIKYDTFNRKDYVEQLLKYVSLKHIISSYYWNVIRKDEFLKNDAAGHKWLVDSFFNYSKSPFQSHQKLHIFSHVSCDYSHYEWDVRDKSLTTLKSRPKRKGCAMVKHDRSIYAFGKGLGFKYDTTSNEWSRADANIILIKPWPGICSHGDGIYLIGGTENGQQQKSFVRYDVETSQWTTLPDLKYARSSPGVVSCNSSIYAFGGYISSMDTVVERFDPREGKWFDQSRLNLQCAVSSVVVSEYNICSMVYMSGKVIYFDPRSLNSIDITSKKGTSLASLDGRLYTAHQEGIAEYNPYTLEWNEIIQESFTSCYLIA